MAAAIQGLIEAVSPPSPANPWNPWNFQRFSYRHTLTQAKSWKIPEIPEIPEICAASLFHFILLNLVPWNWAIFSILFLHPFARRIVSHSRAQIETHQN